MLQGLRHSYWWIALVVVSPAPLAAADPFQERIRPFLTEYCLGCHNKDVKKGDLDLARFDAVGKLANDFRQWEHVVTFLRKQEMPPAKSKQPTAELRAKILAALDSVLLNEARKFAGDPGVAPPRRLTNAEYDFTIHDLTGVDIRPAKAFPVDPASGEGFTNTGEALTVSPALFKKYYAAAELVADHALLTTGGLRFAPHPVVAFADRQKFTEQAIIRFYESHAVDLERCFTSVWQYQHRPAALATLTLDAWATREKLSPKYLGLLWDALRNEASDPYFLGWLAGRWKALPTSNAEEAQKAIRSLAADVRKLSKDLVPVETPAIVSNAGNGPINHLDRRRKTAAARDGFHTGNLTKLGVPLPNLPGVDANKPVPKELEASGRAFCRLFPNRFYYVDATRGLSAGFHLIEGFFRDDQPLCRSVLSDDEIRELDRLWAELYFVTGIWEKELRGFVFFERSERNFLKHADFDSFKEEDPDLVKDETLARFQDVYAKRATGQRKGDAAGLEPIHVFFNEVRAGLKSRTETLKRMQPVYLADLKAFAGRAYRRPLTSPELKKLELFYTSVCLDKEQGVEAAVRASVVRVLVSPHFTMHFNPSPAGTGVAPLPDLALASRLSYFLWSSPPDVELLALAEAGKLRDERVLRQQVQRMAKDPKVSRFALEFFGQWLGYHDFPAQEAVSREAFPAFDDALKQAMFEEPTRVIADMIQNDRPITDLLQGDATFVNGKLAQHYGLKVSSGDWQRVDGLHALGRGGVLGMAVILTKNSQPQRTSPVKRGFWVVHKLLGEHIPPPPPDVAVLPAKETDTNGKTIRELLKLHVEDAKCAACHQRFDPVGLAMEGFDPIGRSRTKDLAGRAIDNAVRLPDGTDARGVPQFGRYLAEHRKSEFTHTLCHKLLGYALGRSLQISDRPLLEQLQTDLDASGRTADVLERIVMSPQFRTQRCRDFDAAKFRANPPPGDE